jgi:hypothetical protein
VERKFVLILLITGFLCFILSLINHSGTTYAVFNSVSLIAYLFLAKLWFKDKLTNNIWLLPLLAFIPLFHHPVRYPLIPLLELSTPGAFIFFTLNKNKLLNIPIAIIWITCVIVAILLQGNILNLPSSFDKERLILPDPTVNSIIKRQTEEALYLPYRLRIPVYVTFGYANYYLTNLFGFLKYYNFYTLLLPVNFFFFILGIYYSFINCPVRLKLVYIPLLISILIAGMTKLPDKFLFLYACRGCLVILSIWGFFSSGFRWKYYAVGFIASLFLNAYAIL